ncbi:hypothetical protein [Xanthomonas phage X1]|nr:hypothetical protein [Xanthomonas phage X1]
MAKHVELTPTKTYKTPENAHKAVEKLNLPDFVCDRQLRYVIMTHTDGRFYPVFLGEPAVQAGVHFHFCVLG